MFCDVCQKSTRHTEIEYRGKRPILLFKCSNCGNIVSLNIEVSKSVAIKVIHSVFDVSYKKTIEIDEGKEICVGDEIRVDGRRTIVTSIEDLRRSKVEREVAKNISTIWVKDIESVKVKVSINAGRETLSKEILCEPEKVFCVGDIIELDDIHCKITKIKLEKKFITKGCCEAKNIIRIYSKILNNR